LNCLSISILCVLDQKNHQESNDRSAGVDDQLPRVAVVEQWAGDYPRDDDCDGEREYFWPTTEM